MPCSRQQMIIMIFVHLWNRRSFSIKSIEILRHILSRTDRSFNSLCFFACYTELTQHWLQCYINWVTSLLIPGQKKSRARMAYRAFFPECLDSTELCISCIRQVCRGSAAGTQHCLQNSSSSCLLAQHSDINIHTFNSAGICAFSCCIAFKILHIVAFLVYFMHQRASRGFSPAALSLSAGWGVETSLLSLCSCSSLSSGLEELSSSISQTADSGSSSIRVSGFSEWALSFSIRKCTLFSVDSSNGSVLVLQQ